MRRLAWLLALPLAGCPFQYDPLPHVAASRAPSPGPSPSAAALGSRTLVAFAKGFGEPNGLALGAAGELYVADAGKHQVLKVAADGTVTTLAGSVAGFADGASAQFNGPYGLARRRDGSLVVADTHNHRIRAVATDGTVTTLAGTGAAGQADGAATAATFNLPFGVAVDALDAVIIADTGNHRLRKLAGGRVTTLAGSSPGYADGPLAEARFSAPADLAFDHRGRLYVADLANHAIRTLDLGQGLVTTLAGNGTPGLADGPAAAARFDHPAGLDVAPDGTVYVADTNNHALRKITPAGIVSTLATTPDAPLLPNDVALGPAGDLYTSDTTRQVVMVAH